MSKRASLKPFAFLATLVLLSACSSGKSGSSSTSAPAASAALESHDAKLAKGPEGTYSRTCGYCHGTNVGPVILGQNLPPDAIVAIVRAGRGAMPAFRPTEIGDAELEALAGWVSKSRKAPNEHGK